MPSRKSRARKRAAKKTRSEIGIAEGTTAKTATTTKATLEQPLRAVAEHMASKKATNKRARSKKTTPPAGTRHWETRSKLISGGALGEMAKVDSSRASISAIPTLIPEKYDPSASSFHNIVDVRQKDAFTLTPLMVTEGPLKGKRILVLDSIKTFRFLDLPAEIRIMIYAYLVEEPAPILLTMRGRGDENERVVRGTPGRDDLRNHPFYSFRIDKSKDSSQCNFALARVNKQIATEVDPIMYGDNDFDFKDFPALGIFLDTIGDKSAYLQCISIIGHRPYSRSQSNAIFNKLRLATDLREFNISHSNLNGETHRKVTAQKFVKDARGFLRSLHRAVVKRNAVEASSSSVLDIIRVMQGIKCKFCFRRIGGHPHICEERRAGLVACRDPEMKAHVATVAAEVRRVIEDDLRPETVSFSGEIEIFV